jgi:hypothetical protein
MGEWCWLNGDFPNAWYVRYIDALLRASIYLADRRYDRYAKADTRFAPEGIYFMMSHRYLQFPDSGAL